MNALYIVWIQSRIHGVVIVKWLVVSVHDHCHSKSIPKWYHYISR